MKKFFLAIAAIIMVAGTITFVACNKEHVDIVMVEPIAEPQTKEAYPRDPSWSHESVDLNILRSRSQRYWYCTQQIYGYFCGLELKGAITDGPACVYASSGVPCGLMLKTDFLLDNDLASLCDSAANGYLTFHADINVLSESLQQLLGVELIPAGRYQATTLGDSAIYVQFLDVR